LIPQIKIQIAQISPFLNRYRKDYPCGIKNIVGKICVIPACRQAGFSKICVITYNQWIMREHYTRIIESSYKIKKAALLLPPGHLLRKGFGEELDTGHCWAVNL